MKSKHLHNCVAELKQLVTSATEIPFITTAHVVETRHKAVKIGANLIGEARNRYTACMESAIAGLAYDVASLELTTAPDVVSVVASEVAEPVWKQKLESLGFSLESLGLEIEPDNDDGFEVKSATVCFEFGKTPIPLIRQHLPAKYRLQLSGAEIKTVSKALSVTGVEFELKPLTMLDPDEMLLLLDALADVKNDDACTLRVSILASIGINET